MSNRTPSWLSAIQAVGILIFTLTLLLAIRWIVSSATLNDILAGVVIGSVVSGAFTLVALLFGFVTDREKEKVRRAEDRRDQADRWAEERRLRQITRELDSISALQFSLSEVLHGTWVAANHAARVLIDVDRTRAETGSAAETAKVVPDLSDAPWYQANLAAIRTAGIMASRISDPELQRLTGECMCLFQGGQQSLERGDDATFQRKWYPEMTKAVMDANDYAGRRYRHLETIVGF